MDNIQKEPLQQDDIQDLTATFNLKRRKKWRNVEYGKLVMIYEENAPFPPPCAK